MCIIYSDPDGKLKLKKKEKVKQKKKATGTKVHLIDVDSTGEMLECQLETSKHPTVSFKFNKDEDQVLDITDTLVSTIIRTSIYDANLQNIRYNHFSFLCETRHTTIHKLCQA